MKFCVTLTIFLVMGAQVMAEAPQLNVLLFHGGRPWTGRETARVLRKAGFKVTLVGSAGLDGLGGAPIRFHLTDKFEPAPKDMITPEFSRLGNYDAVIVSAIKPEDQKKFFTEDRVGELKNYLDEGGCLVTTENVPATVTSLLPVTFDSNGKMWDDEWFCEPVSDIFRGLPEKWPLFSRRGRCPVPKTGASVLAKTIDPRGAVSVPYVVSLKIGQGTSIYLNAEWRRENNFRQLRDWAYFKQLLPILVRYGAGRAGEGGTLEVHRQPPAPRGVETARVILRPPELVEIELDASPEIEDDEDALRILFANGVLVDFDKKRVTYNVFYSGCETPVMRNVPAPILITDRENASKKLDMSTYEAVATDSLKACVVPLTLHYQNWATPGDGVAEILLTGDEGEAFHWTFKAGALTINEMAYQGLAVKSRLEGIPQTIESLKFISPVTIGDSQEEHCAWRMACYAPPRGFGVFKFDGDKKNTTNTWWHFGSGQPFNWLQNRRGVFCEFLDSPFVNGAEITNDNKNRDVLVIDDLVFGRVKCPVETPFVWRYFSPRSPVTPNAWMGMYQFLRKRYRSMAGLSEPLLYPEASHTNTCSPDEFKKSVAASKKLGFRAHKLPTCPSSIESLITDARCEQYQQIKRQGLEPATWSAGGYTQGLDNPVATIHPEWLVRDKAGDPLQYFGSHPVFDINNPEYLDYYLGVLGRAADSGMKNIYLDMGGQQASVTNYLPENDLTQLASAIKIYKFLDGKGVKTSIEGMNPLVIDEFWFRKDKYVDHAGKEFAFVGMSPSAKIPDHLAMDYFRMAMFYAFVDVIVSGYACGMDTVPEERRLIEEIGALNPIITEALDTLGVPFVRQTCFGTSWTSPKGAALFFWSPVETCVLDVPDDWKVLDTFNPQGKTLNVDGNVLRDVPSKSVVLLGERRHP